MSRIKLVIATDEVILPLEGASIIAITEEEYQAYLDGKVRLRYLTVETELGIMEVIGD